MRSFFSKIRTLFTKQPLLLCGVFSLIFVLLFEIGNTLSLWDALTFVFRHPIAFVCNFLLLFTIFVPCVFFGRRRFYLLCCSILLALIPILNAVLLFYRGFPFVAGDLLSFASGPDILFSYLSIPQFILICAALVSVAAGLVLLFFRLRKSQRPQGFSLRLCAFVSALSLLLSVTTVATAGTFWQDPVKSYPQNGLAYSVMQSLFHRYEKKPKNYSAAAVETAQWHLIPEVVAHDTPNIIYIQLEAFSDFMEWNGLTASEYPTPYFHSLLETCPSGYFQIDKVGFGTADTEFEVLTAIDVWDVGIAALPYNTLLQSRTCESVASVLSRYGYATTALHNHAYTFYGRHKVYANLGFDTFFSSETMQSLTYNSQNWERDDVFIDLIPQVLSSTPEKDFLFAITVQGHGNYPDSESDNAITVQGAQSEAQNARYSYYFSQLKETDDMLRALFASLEQYDEEVTVLLYGDHMPGIQADDNDVKKGDLYHTQYVIWNNRQNQGAPVRQDLQAYQITPHLFSQLGIEAGTMIRARQSAGISVADIKLLTYDILHGKQYCIQAVLPIQTELLFGDALTQALKRKEFFDAS